MKFCCRVRSSTVLDAQTHGAELSSKWQPVRSWTISAAVTETRGGTAAMNATPEYLFNIQSRVNLPHRIEFDSGLYHYSSSAHRAQLRDSSKSAIPECSELSIGSM